MVLRRKDQKCEAIKVEDGNNWEKFYWPQNVRKSSPGPETGGETKLGGSTMASSVVVADKETKSNTKESKRPSVSGSNHSITTVNTTVTGNNNSLSGGNVFGRDRSHRQDILNQPEPLFIVAFSVMLFAVFLALNPTLYKIIFQRFSDTLILVTFLLANSYVLILDIFCLSLIFIIL